MKSRFTLLLILLLFSALVPMTSTKAQEMDYVAAAVAALQTSNIYVHPGTPNTDYNTPNELVQLLRNEDNVVLVMLPPDAKLNSDILTIAKNISTGLSNQKTIGLAVGDEVIGYSQLLPEGVAYDLMQRADDVSSDASSTLVTFSQNVHLWLSRNKLPTPSPTPEPTPTPRPTMQPIELPEAEDIGWPVWTCFTTFIVLFFYFLAKVIRDGVKRAKEEEKRQERYNGLEKLRQKIEAIEIDIYQILDKKIKKDLQGAILLAYGLIDMLEEHKSYIGMTESLTPDMINNMGSQVKALLRHESGRRPMSEQLYGDLTDALTNYDSLFQTLQADDPNGAELLASVIQTKTAVISRKGYLE